MHRPGSLPEELEPLAITVVPSFAELLNISKSIITLMDQIDLGEVGRWWDPQFTDENHPPVRRFGDLSNVTWPVFSLWLNGVSGWGI